jgi:hypothetical protein
MSCHQEIFDRLAVAAAGSLCLEAGDWLVVVARVEAELFTVEENPEVRVLDQDPHGLPGVGAADPEPLPGDHDDAIAGNTACDADRPGTRCGQWVGRDARAAEVSTSLGRGG